MNEVCVIVSFLARVLNKELVFHSPVILALIASQHELFLQFSFHPLCEESRSAKVMQRPTPFAAYRPH